MTTTRRTSVSILYQGKDISREIAPFLLSFTFTDNSGGQADDISLSFEDRGGLWLNDWTPAKSDIITASIIHSDGSETLSLPCGSFSVDQIDFSLPPAVFTVKAVSSSIKKRASTQKKTRFWENVSLRTICSQIAADNSLSLSFSSSQDSVFERIDQTEQSDLDFLKTLCADFGLTVKVQESRLIIYDLAEAENSSPVDKISVDEARVISCRFTNKAAQIFRKARVRYHNPVKNETYESEYDDEDEEGSERELEIHERVESQAEAERVVEQRLTSANRREITGSLTLMGDPRLAAGVTIELSGLGMFSSKFFVNKATHKVDGTGYTTTLELGMPKAAKSSAKKVKARRQAQGSASSSGSELYYEGDRHY